MDNIFGFEYEVRQLHNEDVEATPSRFSYVIGKNGMIIHTKKDSYKIIHTADIDKLAQNFINGGYKTTSFTHNDGEVIGLSMMLGSKPTAIGEKVYKAIITIPNNGGGKGYLSIDEVRLICLNGATRTVSGMKEVTIKIPHTIDYQWYIKTMQESIETFSKMLEAIEAADSKMDAKQLQPDEVMFHLNKWFFDYEFPISQKGEMTFEEFRRNLYSDTDAIKCYDRYQQLRNSYKKELEHNEELGLELSMYTVFATVTNYLSRRMEKSKTAAPKEIKLQRDAEKLKYFEAVV